MFSWSLCRLLLPIGLSSKSGIGHGPKKTHQIIPWSIHTRISGNISCENEEIDTEQDRQRYGINMHHE